MLPALWARLSVHDLTPFDWNRRFLPAYFGRFAPADFHADLDLHLHNFHATRGVKRSVIAPRGGAKSTWCTLAYPLRAALELWEPYTLVLSDSSEQANELLRHIKSELETNEEVAAVYPDAAGEGPEWRENRVRLRNGAVVEALGTGKKIRGRRNRSERPSLVIFDDIQSNEDIVSPTLRERAWSWAAREVMPAGDERTNFLAVGSAIHPEAVSVRLGGLPGWVGRTYKAVHAWPGREDLWDRYVALATNDADEHKVETARGFFEANRAEMEAGSHVYWPARYTIADLVLKRAEIGPDAFAGEYQGVPTSAAGAEWPAEWFDRAGLWFDDWPGDVTLRVIALDPSKGKDAKHGDFRAYVALGRCREGRLWVEADLARENPTRLVEAGFELAQRFPRESRGHLDAFGVEVNAFQELLAADFERLSRERGIMLPLHTITNTTNKLVRIRRLSPYLQRSNIRFRHTPGTRLLVQQLRDFPVADHDDGPDALEMALRLAIEVHNGRPPRGR